VAALAVLVTKLLRRPSPGRPVWTVAVAAADAAVGLVAAAAVMVVVVVVMVLLLPLPLLLSPFAPPKKLPCPPVLLLLLLPLRPPYSFALIRPAVYRSPH
jgi:hypothetical protein